VTQPVYALMHPRAGTAAWPSAQRKRVAAVLDFVRAQGTVHPRQVDDHFAHGTVKNYWGGSSNATTHLLDGMHYRGMLRVVRREAGIRLYEARELLVPPSDKAERLRRLDALVDVAVQNYAPLPGPSLSTLIRRLRYGAPQWRRELTAALQRATRRLAHTRVDGVEWYWPAAETVHPAPSSERVYLLAPFDPVVWDRRRFEIFWGWPYRFEAYTPASKRTRGYYALPLLWRERVIGWANISIGSGVLQADLGYIGRRPRDRNFSRELEAELERLRRFLGIGAQSLDSQTPIDPG
jgi:uncharacterized protein YcaQ